MHPDIASFPNEMFYRREQLECVPLPHQQTDVIYPTPLPHAADGLDTLLHHHRLLYFPSAGNLSPTQSDKVNPVEARIVARIVGRIYSYCGKDFDPDRTVGVIVPYRNQIAMIRREIEQMGIEPLTRISIDTVERYQGSQRDVIIYSFTIQHAYQLDFLTANCMEEDGLVIDRKLNVALTRARKQLIITGHEHTLRQNALKGLISKESPVGKAVLGKKIGDRVEVVVSPTMKYTVEIREITPGEDDSSLEISSY